MGRKGKRRRLDVGIYADQSGISVRVGKTERRFGLGTPLVLLKQVRTELLRVHERKKDTGTANLRRDSAKYLKRKAHLQNPSSVRAELDAWIALYGNEPRHTITRDDVLDARAAWLEQGLAPKTINNRVNRLRALFRELDGPGAWSPTDTVRPLNVPRTPAQRISPNLVLSVLAKMDASPFRKKLAKARARFMVYATTGRRPSEIARTKPEDVNFEARVWTPRDGKGGYTPGIYLNDDMLVAWKAFRDAKAWGSFNSRVFPRTLRRYGWPAGVRPYNLRHTIGLALSEAGYDLADIGPHLGHKRIETTRRHYVPVLNSRMQSMSEAIGSRFSGFGVPQNGSTNERETPSDSEGRQAISEAPRQRGKRLITG